MRIILKLREKLKTTTLKVLIFFLSLIVVMYLINLIFPNLFLIDEFFYTYIVAVLESLFTKGGYWINHIFITNNFLEDYKKDIIVFVLEYLSISLLITVPIFLYINKGMNKFKGIL